MPVAARTPLFSPLTAAALLAGIFSATRLPALPSMAVAVMAMLAGAVVWARRKDAWRALGAFLLGAGLLAAQGNARMAVRLPAELAGTDFRITGTIVSLPVHEQRRTRFHFRVDDDAGQPPELRGRRIRLSWFDPARGADPTDASALAESPRWQLRAGERWRFEARLRPPRGLRNPGGFDSERQMLLEGVAASGHLRNVEEARRLAPATGLQAWRERMSDRIVGGSRPDSARFVAALGLGDTRGLSEADWRELRATGLTHLIAISGFHVGLVGMAAAALAWALCRLLPSLTLRAPRRIWMLAASTLGAFAYLLATGASLPTVRTVLMIGFVAGAMILRRQTGIAQSVALAIIAMLLMDPFSVLQPGFWLSFGGVVWLAWCLQSARAGHIRQFLAAQGVASLGLLPLTVVFFGQASLAGPLANLLAVPLWSLIVVPLSILGVMAEMLVEGAGSLFWRLAGLAFEPSWWLFQRMAASPLAFHWLPEGAWHALPLALLAIFVWLLPRGVPGKALAALLCLPMLWPALSLPAKGGFEVVQLDVGQGTAMLVRTADRVLLYDAGPAVPDGFDAGERAVVPALHALGVRRIDTLVISHADQDHAGGLAAVMAAFPVGELLAPPDAGVEGAVPCIAGESRHGAGVEFRFLHPSEGFPYFRNRSSCVLRVEGEGGTALLTGDIDDLIESRLLRIDATALRADVVSVPHHGSASSSSPGFVAATSASIALVSAGHGNRFGHPRASVLDRWAEAGAEPVVGFEHGAVRVRLGADGIRWQGERDRRRRFWDGSRP